MIAATVVIPTHDHGPLLNYSIGSVLAQTVRDIEVFVIGDGVPDVTRTLIRRMMDADARIRFWDHPKGQRLGEVYRHIALAEARGRIVCYLSDDDLWLPNHIENVGHLLENADWAHSMPVYIQPEGGLGGCISIDHADPRDRVATLAAESRGKPRLPELRRSHARGVSAVAVRLADHARGDVNRSLHVATIFIRPRLSRHQRRESHRTELRG